jgi:hypothetical protein
LSATIYAPLAPLGMRELVARPVHIPAEPVHGGEEVSGSDAAGRAVEPDGVIVVNDASEGTGLVERGMENSRWRCLRVAADKSRTSRSRALP